MLTKNSILSIMNQLKICSSRKQLESLYSLMLKNGATKDCFLMNQFIATCSKLNNQDFASLAFSYMENPNVFVYNALIRAFVHCHSPVKALLLYIDMLRTQNVPTSYTFSSVIKGCTLMCGLRLGECVHGQIWGYGFGSHVFVQTGLIDFYSNLGRVNLARLVFDEMPERDNFAWAAMVSAHASAGDLGSARSLFDEMPEKITAACNAMINGYARAGDVGSAEQLFKEMSRKDLIAWTTMINCYCQNRKYELAIEVFYDMKSNLITPDEVTMTTVISACAHLGVLDQGKEMHLYVMQNGFDLGVHIGSALIDMYAKCGSLERSLLVFYKLREKNLFCWNSVIDGLALHGYAEEALALFSRMVKEKVKPNGITFVSVLTACTHAGLAEKGRKTFLSMTQEYDIVPETEHYGCMVDLLCKAGLLEEALEIIRSMRVEPNAVIWGALLGGCKLHKNLEIAQVAVKNLSVLEPNNSAYYTLLVNMYANANRWSEVARIRVFLRELGVGKEYPGSSWIEIEKKIHQFAACDNYHHSSQEIYSLLDGLDGQLKLAGQVQEFEFVF
ncbi:Pentatricopeptide repeat-containing protein [Capsicum annuum]|uniref:Pentatricopeptide repeat-containing protein n=1 Tax=Capsicum annuum TaxID=4072 RepID=A0A2G3ACH2_CAPAN|nr:pentatricopeptide repeat-containing protein At1g06143 [Capsicum annuum]KAF3638462.1 Pentatricopeptide repeat-containing protein [Capsicum annuum]KAF3654238.1 Pentatricopeptide repeat-containing protein [Capsicum annuum]PHT91946.1 Pentatricopeptide repeat-containing protein [Capsicum annuum]